MTFRDFAIRMAHEAGTIHLKYFNTGVAIETKSALQDRVTVADKETEAKLVSMIEAEYPHHDIVGEEGQYEQKGSAYQWIIDPLDGTNNFSKGLPIFCVSIALAKDGEVVLGVVFDPTREELFVAEKGKGATLNDKPIHVSKEEKIETAILCTGFYYDRGEPMKQTLKNMEDFYVKGVLGLRRLGSAALDLCYVACSRYDGFWEFELSTWDYAAGLLIVEEAGGKVSDKSGGKRTLEKGYVVASNSLLHDIIVQTL